MGESRKAADVKRFPNIDETAVASAEVIKRLANLLDHGARVTFQASQLPIRAGSLVVMADRRKGADLSDGVIYDSLERPVPIGTVDYETGTICIDYKWLGGKPRVRLRYSYDAKQ